MTTLSAPQLPPAYTAPGQNAPMLNVLGTAVGVKRQHTQRDGQFSCIEVLLQPRQMGPPPHVHYALDEVMHVTEGTMPEFMATYGPKG